MGDGPLLWGSLGRQHSPQGLGGHCRKMGGMDQTGNKSMGKVSHTLVLYCAPAAGDSLAGSQAKRGCELPGAQDQEPWLGVHCEYASRLLICSSMNGLVDYFYLLLLFKS